MKAVLCVAVCVCACAVLTLAQEGLEVGVLPQRLYGTSGTLRYLSTTQILVENFNYDGRAPAVFFYAYPPGVTPSRNGEGGFFIGNRLVRRYTNEDVILDLPSGVNVCGIGTFTVWCSVGRITFTSVTLNANLYGTDENGDCVVDGLSGGTDPCASRECPVGFQCEVLEPTGEAFCNPSCELDNGGCASGERCQLREVQCVRAPCPPEVDCLPAEPDCPPVCSFEFCKANKRAVCTHPNAQSNCTGECPLTFCRACYNLQAPASTPPGDCAAECDDYDPRGRCFRRWVTCVRRAHDAENGRFRNRDRSESNFYCYDPCSNTTG